MSLKNTYDVDPSERSRYTVMYGYNKDKDVVDDRVKINIIFREVDCYARTPLKKRHFIFGIKKACIDVSTKPGNIVDYTHGNDTPTKIITQNGASNTSSSSVGTNLGSASIPTNASLKSDHSSSSTHEGFVREEATLNRPELSQKYCPPNSVSWTYEKKGGISLDGNLDLYVVVDWNKAAPPKNVTINVHAQNMRILIDNKTIDERKVLALCIKLNDLGFFIPLNQETSSANLNV